ncbi:MAG: class I SAM-dependent methyltransferase [Nanoarchaeota archaeon]
MEKREYSLMFETENEHWWFKGKRNIISSQIKKYITGNKNTILDIGCGTGIMTASLKKYGDVVGLDYEIEALRFCGRRGLKNLVNADIMKMPFKKNTFDAVCMFDVLYHKAINSDKNALARIHYVLKPHGFLILTDAADIGVKSRHDIATHVRERYTKDKMSGLLLQSGFKLRRISYFNTFLYPAIYIARALDNAINSGKPAKSNIKKSGSFVNGMLYRIMALEGAIMKKSNLPFGVSIFAVAEKIPKQ